MRAAAKVISGQRRHKPDYQIVLFIGLLMLLGLVVMYAIGPERANLLNTIHRTDFYSENYFVLKQLFSLGVAVCAFVAMATVPFELMKKYAWHAVVAGFGLCALLFIMGNVLKIDQIATETLGAYRWFNLGPLGGFQPAEALKMALLVYMAGFLGRRYQEGKINDLHETIIPMGIIGGAALFTVIILQKDMGTGLAMASVMASMLVVSKIKWSILLKIGLIGLAFAVLAIVVAPHRMERVATFFSGDAATVHSQEDTDGNYHIKNAMIALGTGGVFGRGIGKSIQATGYLPEAINDSIFAIMGEIFGFIGTTLIVALFTGLLLRLLKIADHLPDMSMRLAVAGIFGWLAAHVFLNIASMIGLAPLTGITLPLLSFGGTSMVFITGAIGLAFQLSRYTAHGILTDKEINNADSSSRRRIGGTRYPSRGRTTRN